MVTLIQVLGEPATGKTTLMRSFIESLGESDGEVKNNIGPDGRHFNYARGKRYPGARVLVMGVYDGSATDGTDRLGLNTQPPMLKLLSDLASDDKYDDWAVVLEGDRFANASFLDTTDGICPVERVLLTVPSEALTHRHTLRGDKQSENWLKGRRTKMERLAAHSRMTELPNQTFVHLLRNRHILAHLVGHCQCEVPPDGLPVATETVKANVSGQR